VTSGQTKAQLYPLQHAGMRVVPSCIVAASTVLLPTPVVQSASPAIERGRVAGIMDVFVPRDASAAFTLTLAVERTGPPRDVTQVVERRGPWVRVTTHRGHSSITSHVRHQLTLRWVREMDIRNSATRVGFPRGDQ
jgi:hypothetical protein